MDLSASSSTSDTDLNSNYCKCVVERLLHKPFGSYTFVEKQNIINNGRPDSKASGFEIQ